MFGLLLDYASKVHKKSSSKNAISISYKVVQKKRQGFLFDRNHEKTSNLLNLMPP